MPTALYNSSAVKSRKSSRSPVPVTLRRLAYPLDKNYSFASPCHRFQTKGKWILLIRPFLPTNNSCWEVGVTALIGCAYVVYAKWCECNRDALLRIFTLGLVINKGPQRRAQSPISMYFTKNGLMSHQPSRTGSERGTFTEPCHGYKSR
jgi:hypothetical protein